MHLIAQCAAFPRVPGQLAHDAQEKLSSSFTLNSDESVVLQKLSLDVHTLHLKNNSLLFLLSIESSSGSVEGSGGKQITPYLLNEAFSAKSTRCKSVKRHKEPYDTSR